MGSCLFGAQLEQLRVIGVWGRVKAGEVPPQPNEHTAYCGGAVEASQILGWGFLLKVLVRVRWRRSQRGIITYTTLRGEAAVRTAHWGVGRRREGRRVILDRRFTLRYMQPTDCNNAVGFGRGDFGESESST